MSNLDLPSKLKMQLEKDSNNENLFVHVQESLIPFLDILNENRLFFFSEYTDHGINHIKGVLNSIENLITDDSLTELSAVDICVILVATVLHDIGMHTNAEMFKNLIEGKYDNIKGNLFKDDKSWKELWDEFIKESYYWDNEKKNNLFGDGNHIFKAPNLDDIQSLDDYDKKFVGEFIRIHHARIAYEIALRGYVGKSEIIFNHKNFPANFMQIAGLVARSHGMGVRDTFKYLGMLWGKSAWNNPLGVKIIYLMVLIRLSDYLQIDCSRTNSTSINIRTLFSPISNKEHNTHLAISHIELDNDDKEKIVVQANPENAESYVKIERLVRDIQNEFDMSWAILGEVYGNKYKLRYRRIVTNITDDDVKNGYDYIPKQFSFKINNGLSKLLISPLYGNNPSYGVRELVQNAVDACRTRLAIDSNYSKDITHVKVCLNSDYNTFTIEDTGVGMTLNEIENYFFTIGSSFDATIEWQKIRDTKGGFRTGRFGIGVLAAFLLGNQISVETKSFKDNQGYRFKASLKDKSIQINKSDKADAGTKIEILCDHNSFNRLADSARKRLSIDLSNIILSSLYGYNDFPFDWYVDTLPVVEYYIDDQEIPQISDRLNVFKELNHTSNNYGRIFWKPTSFFKELSRGKTDSFLYCNGFFVTNRSNKKEFFLNNLEKYYKPFVPALYISDKYNALPINIQRDNIDAGVCFPFEKDLVIAIYKDILCQLLSIDLKCFNNKQYLFFNSFGFSFNKSPNYPRYDHSYSDSDLDFSTRKKTKKDSRIAAFSSSGISEPYSEINLLGKTIVQIDGEPLLGINLNKWKQLFNENPDVFFTFNKISRLVIGVDVYGIKDLNLYFMHHSKGLLRDASLVKRIEEQGRLPKFGTPYKKLVSQINKAETNNSISNSYLIIEKKAKHKKLINDLTSFIENNAVNAKPNSFIIHEIENQQQESDVDNFFREYAGGDMVIPYDEDKRREKFAKIYEECSEDIERYKQLLNNKSKK